jgi:hypothetical protein
MGAMGVTIMTPVGSLPSIPVTVIVGRLFVDVIAINRV